MALSGSGGIDMRVGQSVTDVTPFVRRFVWNESLIQGGWSWSMHFNTEDWSEWTPLLLGRDAPAYRFRLKSQEGDLEITTDWKQAFVDGSREVFRGESMISLVHGQDARLTLRQKARTRAWPQTSVSDVFERVANEYGLAPAIDTSAPTRDRWQVREDDWSFMRRLLRHTSTDSGRGDVYLWLDEQTLRFGAPVLTVPSARRHDLSEVENRVDRVSVNYSGRLVDRLGGATMRTVAYDLDNAKAKTFKVNPAEASTLPALARKVPRDPADGLRVIHTTEEALGFAESDARAAWGRAAPRYFTLRLDTRPDLTLRPGQLVEVQVNLDSRHDSPFLGRFVVLEITHVVARSAIKTTALCFRREAFAGDADPTGSSAAQAGTRDRYRFGQQNRPSVVLQAVNLDTPQ